MTQRYNDLKLDTLIRVSILNTIWLTGTESIKRLISETLSQLMNSDKKYPFLYIKKKKRKEKKERKTLPRDVLNSTKQFERRRGSRNRLRWLFVACVGSRFNIRIVRYAQPLKKHEHKRWTDWNSLGFERCTGSCSITLHASTFDKRYPIACRKLEIVRVYEHWIRFFLPSVTHWKCYSITWKDRRTRPTRRLC